MADLLALVLAVSPIAVFAAVFALVANRARRRRLGGSVLGPFQEMWDPAGRRTQIEVEIQAEQPAPAPSPDDPLTGRIRRSESARRPPK